MTDKAIWEKSLKTSGFSVRPAQLSMMEAVSLAVQKKEVAVIEGATGVGKSFGYLLPLLSNLLPMDSSEINNKNNNTSSNSNLNPQEKNGGLKIVIATATVNLQEQLFNKDLKIIKEILNLQDLPVELAKGRGRYVCAKKLYGYQNISNHKFQREIDLLDATSSSKEGVYGSSDSSDQNQNQNQNQKYDNWDPVVLGLQDKLSSGEWSGDKDELETPVPQDLWGQLITDVATCTNRRCSYFSSCAYFKAKKNLAKAKVLITNHDLLLSDLAMGSGVVLPELSQTIYVIDEAHHFPQKALGHFASEVEILGNKLWLRSLESYLSKWAAWLSWSAARVETVETRIQELKELLDPWYEDLNHCWFLNPIENKNLNKKSENFSEYLFNSLPIGLREKTEEVQKKLSLLNQDLTALHEGFLKAQEDRKILESELEKALGLLLVLIKRAHVLSRTLDFFMIPDQEPIAKWMTPTDIFFGQRRDYKIHAAWLRAGELLKHYFWQRLKHAVILCSATLRTLGGFSNFLEKIGLSESERLNFNFNIYEFPSPFDYARSELFIPTMKYLPENFSAEVAYQNYLKEVLNKLPDLFNYKTGGVLVLLTSQKLLQDIYNLLDAHWQAKILSQGQETRAMLIKKHCEKIEAGEKSIIFGLQSFFEGVDLPGAYCNHVIIPKLPFASPILPTERAYHRWLESQGKNAFLEHSLPEACLKLVQGVGRLVRTVDDEGCVTILDYRIIKKFYGRRLLNALPNFSRSEEQV